MNISATNSVKFQGKLDLRQVKTNKARWENVAKIFEEKTKNLPNAVIEISERQGNMALLACSNVSEGWDDTIEALFFTSKMQELFDKKSDKSIAVILKRFLNFGVQSEKECAVAEKFAEKMARKAKTDASYDEAFDKIYGESAYCIKEDIKDKISQDKAMKDWEIFI